MDHWPIYTRRHFLHRGITLVGAGATVPTFLYSAARALAGEEPQASTVKRADHPVLVIIQLAGGNDGLNTLIPFEHDVYHRLRPKLAIEKSKVLKLDREVGFHPSATGLKALFDDGLLGVVRGVGYPNPDRSHFRSTDIWATASPTGKYKEGWVGRYFDCDCAGRAPLSPTAGLALTEEVPLAMRGNEFLPMAFETPDRLQIRGMGAEKKARETIAHLNQSKGEDSNQGPMSTLDYLRRTAFDARLNATEIRAAADRKASTVDFPRQGLGPALETIHRLIAAGLPTRIYYATLGGFDTHSQQLGRHAALMQELGGALHAFVRALKESGDLDRTLVMTFSEFGRRVAENASSGTDHGAAAPLFVAGGSVKPGLHGIQPSLDRLVDGDLKFTVDFREVYATVLKDWLGADPAKVLDGRFRTIPFLKKSDTSRS